MRTITLRKIVNDDNSGRFATYEAVRKTRAKTYRCTAFTAKFAVANVCFESGMKIESRYFVRFIGNCGWHCNSRTNQ